MTAAAFRVLSLIPPMTQLNTPYPSTAYLTGFLRSRGIDAVQTDLALALVLRLFTPAGLDAMRERAADLAALEAARVAVLGSSERIARAPSTSRMARDEPEPCHCGTTRNVALMRSVWHCCQERAAGAVVCVPSARNGSPARVESAHSSGPCRPSRKPPSRTRWTCAPMAWARRSCATSGCNACA